MKEDSTKLILVTVSGEDHPGITASLMEVIDNNQAIIEDIGQSVTHGFLSLSILIRQDQSNTPILKDLLFEAKSMNMELEFKLIETAKEINELKKPGDIFVLSCVALEKISATFLKDIAKCLAKYHINIERIDNATKNFNSIEITSLTPNDLNWDQLKKDLISISNQHSTDVAFLKDNIFRRSKRLIVFDMDCTLIETEVINEMAEAMNVGDEIKAITEKAMNGEMDFDKSLTERVSKLEGMKLESMEKIAKNLKLNPGVEEFLKTVKKLGFKVAVISGGFTYFANYLKEKHDIDYVFANELEMRGDQLTGKVKYPIINPAQKAILLDLLSQQENISLEQVVAIGDGANDLPMLAKAGLGIAYHAKPIVKENAPQQMTHGPMTSILYFLGIPGTEAN